MRPILFKVPALPLLIACLLVAVIAVLRDVVPWKGKKPAFRTGTEKGFSKLPRDPSLPCLSRAVI